MTRNHLLKLSTRPRTENQYSVWRMTMDVWGQAFGVPSGRRNRR